MKSALASTTTVQKRLEALSHYDLLDTARDAEFDDLAVRASQVCDTPMATVTLLDEHRQWYKSSVGVDVQETPIEHAFCARAIEDAENVMVVPNALRDERFRNNPLVTAKLGVRFYAGAPLVTPEGVPVGTICSFDRRPRRFSRVKREALRGLASETMALMERIRWRKALEAERKISADLRVSEAYFRHLTEFSLDLISILEADGTIRFESRSIERELGHDPLHYRGRNAFEFVHPEDCPAVMTAFQEALARHGNTPTIRFRFLHADGTYRLLEGSGNNLLDDPVVHGIVFNSRDVTQRVRLQEAVECSRAEKEDMIARLTGGVAHDFNNILTAVQGLAELTEMRVPIGSPEAGYLADIQLATKRAAELTRQMLAFSRRVVLQPRVIELGEWLHALEPRLAQVLGPAVDLTVVAPGQLRLWQDPAQFEQVLLQLAANAREAMPNGGHFTLEASPVLLSGHECPAHIRDGGANYVRLSVIDQGSGMGEDTLARIFEPFFTTKTQGQHPGLGLCMCRGIVEQSGGNLTVQSHPGRGTIFHILLPSAGAIDEEIPPNVPAEACVDIPTILFVDDEPMLREIGETILLEAGYRVLVAEDGPDALVRLGELGGTRLDLLVTDVIMPGMTGVQLAQEISRLRPGTRVLLCSGYTRDALAQAGGVPPGVAFLPKPYTLTVLLDKVSELLSAKVA
jgi:PAS domain S-box-containing protein